MKIHEYQAKELLGACGIPVPRSQVATNPEEAAAAYTALGGELAVVKAQIHAGGRGKGGGVKLVRSAAEAREAAVTILARPLITHQTGPKGQTVRKLLVEAGISIARELYVAVVLDRSLGLPVLMGSQEGGVEIEEVAARSPEKILKEPFDPVRGLTGFQARRICFGLGLGKQEQKTAVPLFMKLCRLFLDQDCSLAEINPLIITEDREVVALDAKMNFDSSALYRHPDVVAFRDREEEDPLEAAASEHDLSWVSLDGEIGCMVNGAGLAMATMDAILLHDGSPANFLDVGGGATADQVREAFKLILGDPQVKAVLVNIFGGIAKCDVIADGILQAAGEVNLHVPLVVRLEGTNVKLGRQKLDESNLNLVTVSTLDEAAQKAVEMSRKGGGNS